MDEQQDSDEKIAAIALELEHLRTLFDKYGFESALFKIATVFHLTKEKDLIIKQLHKIDEEIAHEKIKRSFVSGEKTGSSKVAKAGANARGRKYTVMKTAALEWYGKERASFHNKDEAAMEITKMHPVEFSTARGWLKGV